MNSGSSSTTNNTQGSNNPPASTPVTTVKTTQYIAYTSGTADLAKLELQNLSTNEKITIADNASAPMFSSDGRYIAYLNKPDKKDSNNFPSPDVYVYDLTTKKSTLFLANATQVSNVYWSKDSKYLLTDSGTYIIRAIKIYDFATKKDVGGFSTSEAISSNYNQMYWSDSDTVIFMTNVLVQPGKAAGTGGYSGINKLNIKTGEVTKLLIPANMTEYQFYGTEVSDGKIGIVKIVYSDVSTVEGLSQAKTSYWDLDVSTGDLTTRTDMSRGTDLYTSIKSLLPSGTQSNSYSKPLAATNEPGKYFVAIYTNSNSFNNGKVYKVDTNAGANPTYELIPTDTVYFDFSIF